jgi:hypothetical protein
MTALLPESTRFSRSNKVAFMMVELPSSTTDGKSAITEKQKMRRI